MVDHKTADAQKQHDKKRKRTDRQGVYWVPLALLLGAATYLYLNLFALPRTPFLLGGDQVFFWMDAQRMLGGEKIYRDFFQFTPPGTDLVYLASFKLFGPYLWVTNAAVFVLGVALCFICFAVARDMMDRSSALLASALFLVLIYGKLLNGTHHLFSLLAIMCAVKICMKESTAARSLVAGALLGLASFFTQTHGAVVLFALVTFLAWEQLHAKKFQMNLLRNPVLLLLGYCAALLLLSARFIAVEGVRQLWHFQVAYAWQNGGNRSSFLGLPGPVTWHTLLNLSQYLFVYLLLPVVYLVTLLQCWRERANPVFPWRRVELLSVVGLMLLLEVASSVNWLRVYAVSMPGIILFLWIVSRSGRLWRSVFVMLWIGTICLALLQTVSRFRVLTVIAQLPGGTVAVEPIAYEKLHWIMQHTTPGQFFFQAGWPGVYLPLGLHNPVYEDSIRPGDSSPPESISSTIRLLEERQVKYILWPVRLDSENKLAGMPQDNVLPLRTYVHSRYTQVKVFPDGDSILQRNE
jgi:hypothetical protein